MPTSTTPRITERQAAVLERLQQGMTVKEVADDVGISRNAVYQTMQRLKRDGALDDNFLASRPVAVQRASAEPQNLPQLAERFSERETEPPATQDPLGQLRSLFAGVAAQRHEEPEVKIDRVDELLVATHDISRQLDVIATALTMLTKGMGIAA